MFFGHKTVNCNMFCHKIWHRLQTYGYGTAPSKISTRFAHAFPLYKSPKFTMGDRG